MNALIVLLGILATALAVPAHFPHGKTVTYKYTADVKAGLIKPSSFASQFGIECLLHVRHDVTDPTLRNAYSVTLTDVKHGMFNGRTWHHAHLSDMRPIVDAAKAIQNPFLIVYDENGNFQGVKLMEDEPGWSKNIKKGIASMLQLDLTNIQIQTPMKSHSFVTHEDTIHGNCQVAYDVHALDQTHQRSGNMFVVTKIHEPENCTHFSHQMFNHAEPENCHVQKQDDMTTTSRRVFEIENQGNEILIKKLIGHGVINYLPWLAKSEAHYLLTNQTLILENVAPMAEVQLPAVSFQNIPLIHNVVFDKPQTQHVPQADMDVTQGRHTVRVNELVPKLKKMLDEAAGYLKENHFERKQPDWKHGQTVNRLLHIMSQVNVESLEQVFNELKNAKDAKEITMRNIFLGIVPNVGTTAALLLTRNLVRTNSVPNWTAITMLSKLPMHVKVPSKELLLQMEELLNLGDSVSVSVREASIFCFATLVHKTFMHEHTGHVDSLLDRYLQHFMDHVRNEPTYHMKVVYMLAMKNVRLHHILRHLEPIIRGDMSISEKPHHIRQLAIWITKPVIADDPHHAHDLLWPVLSDVTLPTAIRIVAYDSLMNQLPHSGRLMNIHWFMVFEKNEHLYNYHVDTIKGLANSVDPCLMPVREMARKILGFTRMRHVIGTLSSKFHVDYMNEKYGYGETVKGSLIVDQLTGMPYVGCVEHMISVSRRPFTGLGIAWNIDGMGKVTKDFKRHMFGEAIEALKNDNVKNVLNKAAKDMPAMKDIDINVILMMNNNVVTMLHWNKNNWLQKLDEMKQWKQFITQNMDNMNWQSVFYHNDFEMHVPTDLGVPAVLTSKAPSLDSIRGNVALSEDKSLLGLKLKMKYQSWLHSEHAMTIYNPIADVWHSIRRASTQDIALPVEMSAGYNPETKSLKVTLPRLPFTEFSLAGITTYAKSYVTVMGDETDQLKSSCATCRHYEMVTTDVNSRTFENIVESKDTGLKLTTAVFDCESNITPHSPAIEWLDMLLDEHKNTMDSGLVNMMMSFRQQTINNMISGQEANCATLIKIEPSVAHPTSMVDLTGKVSVQDLDHTHGRMDFLSSMRIDVRGTVNVKAAATDESVRQWDMNVNLILSQGHLNNSMKVMITRTTPGEKNLKICMEAQKDYQAVTSDLMNVDVDAKETNSKMTITMGQTKEDKCVRDEMDVVVTMKGEMSEEQKKHIAHDTTHGKCVKHTQNPLFHTEGSHNPKTWDCIQEAILHSTLRKYTINVTARKVPSLMVSSVNIAQDILRSLFFSHTMFSLNHMEPGNARIVLEFPYLTHHLDTAVVTPTHSFELVQLKFGHPLWNMWMDNTHYDLLKLHKFVTEQMRVCTVYPRVLLTMDNGTIPFIVPDKWTLISGDHIDQTFSIFVKLVQNNKLAMKVNVGAHEMEVTPTDSTMMITVNNNVVNNFEKGIMVPENEPESYAIKLTKAYQHLTIQSQLIPLRIYYLPNSVTVSLDTVLQGQVTGMCGHMDGTHKVELPKIYSVPTL